MYYVYLPASHDECNHYLVKACTKIKNKLKTNKKSNKAVF